jgi:hypothetical protein
MRTPGEKRAIPAEEAHRLPFVLADRSVEVLKISGFDNAGHNVEELAPGPADAARKHDHPGTADLVHNRNTDEGTGIGMLAQVAVKIAVRSIDDRNGPRSRKIHDLAGVIDQSDRVGLGEAVQSVEKEMVNLLGPIRSLN